MISRQLFRRLYSTKPSVLPPAVIQTPATPNIPTPAPAVILFPTLESVDFADFTLNKAASETDSYWYNISRTSGNQLPVYSDVRGNGHRTTIIRRVEGSLPLLKHDLMVALDLSKDDIKIKNTSKQIIVKGDRVKQIRALLRQANL